MTLKNLRDIVAVALLGIVSPCHAFFTECVVPKETTAVNRPEGQPDPRWQPIKNGSKVAIRDTYRDWVFITRSANDQYEYGWLRRSALINCKGQDGTP